MGSKTFIVSVVIMSVLMAQIMVDAKSCCPSTSARNIYNTCRATGASRPTCAKLSGCIIQESPKCRPPNTHDILEMTDVNEYCKLGCVYSVCGALNNLQNSDATEVVSGAVEKCDNVCAFICTKNSMNAVETA